MPPIVGHDCEIAASAACRHAPHHDYRDRTMLRRRTPHPVGRRRSEGPSAAQCGQTREPENSQNRPHATSANPFNAVRIRR